MELANVGRFDSGHLDTTFLTPAPPGTYVVRIRAANAFGVSAPSNEVTVVVP
ncbi:MAG: fibronectin type III domain-containing protein [Vicinamibacterales bacterium]